MKHRKYSSRQKRIQWMQKSYIYLKQSTRNGIILVTKDLLCKSYEVLVVSIHVSQLNVHS